jgi:hypothetical protein
LFENKKQCVLIKVPQRNKTEKEKKRAFEEIVH